MIKLPHFTIKSIALCAVLMPAIALFPSEIYAQAAPDALQTRIELSLQRIASVKPKAKDTQQRYAMEKAQCWLDFAKHEVLRNNPTDIAELAHGKALQLINAFDSGTTLSATELDSSLQKNTARMRGDLWAQLDSVKSSSQMACAVKAVACGEVMLVQAAHAHARIDWRYSQSYFGMAEDWVRSAKKQALACPAQ